jgi:hypothetical protein
VWVNGQFQYTTARNLKTKRGAENRAKKIADEIADEKRYWNHDVTVELNVPNTEN